MSSKSLLKYTLIQLLIQGEIIEMDIYTFLITLCFFLTIVAIVAMVRGDSKVAEKAITGLANVPKLILSRLEKKTNS